MGQLNSHITELADCAKTKDQEKMLGELRHDYSEFSEKLRKPEPVHLFPQDSQKEPDLAGMDNDELTRYTQEQLHSNSPSFAIACYIENDEKLTEMVDVAKETRNAAEKIREENNVHEGLIGTLETEQDRAKEGMLVADTMLTRMMRGSSTCCLWAVIIAETVLIGLVIF